MAGVIERMQRPDIRKYFTDETVWVTPHMSVHRDLIQDFDIKLRDVDKGESGEVLSREITVTYRITPPDRLAPSTR